MSDPYVGEIRMFAGSFAPRGWALCDGQLLAVSSNDALFSLLGTIYGGDGRTTFALPDLRSRIPVHAGTPSGGPLYRLGAKAGQENVTLTTQQLPSHSHTPQGQSANGSSAPGNSFWAASATQDIYSNQAPAIDMNPAAVLNEGGGQPHNNMMPVLGIYFIISLFGIYPSRQ